MFFTNRPLPPLIVAAAVLMLTAGCQDKPADKPAAKAARMQAGAPEAAAGDALAIAAKGTGFTAGSMMATRQIYVFFDPQCPHCGHLWEATKPLATQLRMVWIPVGFIAPRSTQQGAALLAASDPVAAMDLHEKSLLAQKGGLVPPDNLPADLQDKVRANTKLWQQLGGESVPFTVFKNPATGQPGKFAGALDTESLKKLIGI